MSPATGPATWRLSTTCSRRTSGRTRTPFCPSSARPRNRSEKGSTGVTTMTATLDQPRRATPVATDTVEASRDIALGLPAALLVSSWMFVFDRHLTRYDSWALIALFLAYLALARPIARRGMLRRGWFAAVQLGTLLLIVLTADRALAAWEERSPRFDAASSVVFGRAQPRGLSHGGRARALADRPPRGARHDRSVDGKARSPAAPALLAGLGSRCGLVREHRRAATCCRSRTGHDTARRHGALCGSAGGLHRARRHPGRGHGPGRARTSSTSPWITGFFLVPAGFAADRACLVRCRHGTGNRDPAADVGTLLCIAAP